MRILAVETTKGKKRCNALSFEQEAKLLARILDGKHDASIPLDDLCTAVLGVGFQLRPGKGSHRIFTREGIPDILNLQPGKDGCAKPYQVRQVRKVLKAYDLV